MRVIRIQRELLDYLETSVTSQLIGRVDFIMQRKLKRVVSVTSTVRLIVSTDYVNAALMET